MKSRNVLKNRFSPLLKYPGGKESELSNILPALPYKIARYYEPFVGAGAVYFSIDADHYLINDKSSELIRLYKMVKNQDVDFIGKLRDFNHNWQLITNVVITHSISLVNLYRSFKHDEISSDYLMDTISLFVNQHEDEFNGMLMPNFNVRIDHFKNELIRSIFSKMSKMKKIEKVKSNLNDVDILKNIEGSFKNAFYIHFRYLYNLEGELLKNGEITSGYATAIYLFIRLYCYSSMYRYNKKGIFNVPYGGISYNNKSMEKFLVNYSSSDLVKHLNKTIIEEMDFYDFIQQYPPNSDDFLFIDPPYDTEFSSYANMAFDKGDQKRLSDYLIDVCKGNFMVVIKNTEYIRQLYPEGKATANEQKVYITSFSKKYMVSFQDRNNKEAEHLLITNYELDKSKFE